MRSFLLLAILASFLLATKAFQPAFNIQTRHAATQLFMSDDEATKCTGTVKWFNTLKGFGFIMPDDGTSDVFVHQTSIQADGFRSLADGEPVEYLEELDGSGRKRAIQVTGPGGVDVQGAPFRPSSDYDSY